jgi:unsaturated chondroitin disaccharide hydrolase
MQPMKRILGISIAAALLLAALTIYFAAPPAQGQFATGCSDQALALAEGQLTDTYAYTSTAPYPIQFPTETNPANGNKWDLARPSYWTSGFYPGLLWYMYERTLSDSWFTRATQQTDSMIGEDTNASDHDIGFKILGSVGNAYRITRDPAYMKAIQTAAQAMVSSLYRPNAGVFESWPNFDSHITVIIDNMMNLELPLFAAQNGGDPNWHKWAVNHAVKTMDNHVRADGSTFHVVDYDDNGNVISRFTWQGASNDSTWARGQAWAIYGFTMTYRYTKDVRFLTTAQSLADYFLKNLPSDFIPYWDFSKNCCNNPRDSSAAAIAAAGLLELSTYAATQTDKDRYRTAALNIQSSLSSSAYLGRRLATQGILLHGSANVPGGDSDKSLIYGDYYFIQGCYRAKTPPPAPANLIAIAVSSTQADLSWTAQTGAIRYSVKRATKSGGPYTTFAPPPVLTKNSFADASLTAGATYYYVVSAIGVGGEGADSVETSATTPKVPAPMISTIAPTSATAGGPGFTLTVNGGNFASSSIVRFKGVAKSTTFVNNTQLKAAIAVVDVTAAGSFPVTVFDSSSGETSNATMFTVNKAATSTSLVSSLNPALYGRAITLTATTKPATSGFPSGTVTFKDGTVSLGTGTLSNGKATIPRSNLAARSHTITAFYSGDANYTGSTSPALTQNVTKAGTIATVYSSLNPSRPGSSVTFTALLRSSTSGTPTGIVTFKDGTTTLGTGTLNNVGKASYATSTLAVGTHSITVDYPGSTNFTGSASPPLTQTVNP